MKTILVIDDEYVITEILSGVLEDAGYRVVTAGDGRAGLARLAEIHPDLVLSDVMMPLLDGRELSRRIHDDPAYRKVPVVLMSAASAGILRDGDPHIAFLAKPFELDAVLLLVRNLIGDAAG